MHEPTGSSRLVPTPRTCIAIQSTPSTTTLPLLTHSLHFLAQGGTLSFSLAHDTPRLYLTCNETFCLHCTKLGKPTS